RKTTDPVKIIKAHMMNRNLFLASLALVAMAACSTERTGDSGATLSLQWEIVASPALGTDETHSTLTITNNTADTLGATGWSIYFNTGVARVADADTTVAGIELINGDF